MEVNSPLTRGLKTDLIGFGIVKSYILNCADCAIPLVEIILSETNESRESRGVNALKNKFKVNHCYKCGGSSLPSEIIDGSIFIGSLRDNYTVDTIDTDILEDGTIYTILNTRKNTNVQE